MIRSKTTWDNIAKIKINSSNIQLFDDTYLKDNLEVLTNIYYILFEFNNEYLNTVEAYYQNETVPLLKVNPIEGYILDYNSKRTAFRMRVASYNVGDFTGETLTPGTDETRLIYRKTIAETNADIIALQEDVNTFNGSTDLHNEIYGMYKYRYHEYTGTTNGKAFVSKYVLNSPYKINYTDTNARHPYFIKSEIYVDNKRILLICFHFDWYDKYVRANEAQQIRDYVKTWDYAIVMGDTNNDNYINGVKQSGKPYLYEEEWKLWTDDGFVSCNNGYFDLFGTYYDPSVEKAPIDNIFLWGNITLNNVFVI